jgi:hypothetical protein
MVLFYFIEKVCDIICIKQYLSDEITIEKVCDIICIKQYLIYVLNSKICNQFGDIYQEEYFINILKDDISIVKELPPDIKPLDAEAIGSQVDNLTYPLYLRTHIVLVITISVIKHLTF